MRSFSRQLRRPATSFLSAKGSSSLRPTGSPLRALPGANSVSGARTLTASASLQGKVLMVLYDVSVQSSRSAAVFHSTNPRFAPQGGEHAKQQPGLLGTTENELGLRKWLEDQGHTLVTTSDKEGENSTFDKELVDAEVIITTPSVDPLLSPSTCFLPPS